jgi:hypothetical protein
MTEGSELRLALADPQNGKSQWLRVGETFNGHRVVSFDPKREAVAVVRDGHEYWIPLKEARVRSGPAESGTAAARRIHDNLAFLAAAAAQFFQATGKSRATIDDLVGPEKYIEVLRPVQGEDYSALRFERTNNRLSLTTADGETVTFDAQNAPSSGAQFHLIRDGDSLERIAAAAGSPMQRVLELNELAEPQPVRVGRLLRTQ